MPSLVRLYVAQRKKPIRRSQLSNTEHTRSTQESSSSVHNQVTASANGMTGQCKQCLKQIIVEMPCVLNTHMHMLQLNINIIISSPTSSPPKKQHENKILRQRCGSTFPSLQTSCLCAAALAAACGAAALTGFWGSLETEQPTDLPVAGKNQTKGLSAPPLLAHRCNHMRLHTLAAHSQTCPPPAWLLTSVPDSQWCHTCRY